MENVKKCKSFLATLIKLASTGKQSTETAASVRELVKDLLVSELYIEQEIHWNCPAAAFCMCFTLNKDIYFKKERSIICVCNDRSHFQPFMFVFCNRRANWKLRNSPADYTKS